MNIPWTFSTDWLNIINIPLMLLVLRDTIPKWSSIWDENFTEEDRQLLLRFVMFWILPLVVLIHELGHAFADISVGAQIIDFHYGPVMGYVRIANSLPAPQDLWVTFAGSLFQIILGIIALTIAALPFCKSPPLVAFCVYIGLLSISETVFFYALLSLVSDYGDWVQIYTNPYTPGVTIIAIIHIFLILFIIWCIKSKRAKIWFICKTNLEWQKSYLATLKDINEAKTPANYQKMSLLLLNPGLFKEAQECLLKAEKLEPKAHTNNLILAQIYLAQAKYEQAINLFDSLKQDSSIDIQQRAVYAYEIAQIWLYKNDINKTLTNLNFALELNPFLGDARLLRAKLFLNSNNLQGLKEDLEEINNLETQWLQNDKKNELVLEIEYLQNALHSNT